MSTAVLRSKPQAQQTRGPKQFDINNFPSKTISLGTTVGQADISFILSLMSVIIFCLACRRFKKIRSIVEVDEVERLETTKSSLDDKNPFRQNVTR